MNIPEWIAPAAWGSLAGAAAISVVSLSAGWTVTHKAAIETADAKANQAVIAALTPVCIAQFTGLADERRQVHIAALEAESSWQRGDYIEEQGWATLPGMDEPSNAVADACAEQLLSVASS